MIFFDTESVGFYGPTVLIQYAEDNNEPTVYNIWDHSVKETIALIKWMCEYPNGVVGFNLTHDWFHLSRTYNILHNLPQNSPPNVLDYLDIEDEDTSHDLFCLKPQKAVDLLIVGRKGKFQSTLNQKDITLRRVPTVLSQPLAEILKDRIQIPGIYFSKNKGYVWDIIPLIKGSREELTPEHVDEEIDPDFVNLKLRFAPSASLKSIMKMLGQDIHTLDEYPLPKVEEYAWWPSSGKWVNVWKEHIFAWRNDPRRLLYAKNDVIYTRKLYNYLDCPSPDADSLLACAVGSMHWRGFSVDLLAVRERRDVVKKVVDTSPINMHSHRQVKNWLWESATPLEKQAIQDTAAETLRHLVDEWKGIIKEKAEKVLEVRRASMELQLLERLLVAKRMYVVYKVLGTKSNRMSGGSESYLKTRGSINPQGIKKGDKIRILFTLAGKDMVLCGGDFAGFEVSIAEAVYQDPLLREEMLKGKKIHGLFGAEMYNKTYEEIMLTESFNINDPQGYYQRAKRGFFASLYGAEAEKLGKSMWISTEEAQAGLDRFRFKYKKIQEHKNKLTKRFSALIQPEAYGKIQWVEPCEYEESFLGFKRYFNLEFSIMRALFELANNVPPELADLGKNIHLVRRDRIQSGSGALMSALFALAFSVQGQVIRAAGNHDIQSPGGQLTKELQSEIWTLQPFGITTWQVMPMNSHDEIQSPCRPELVGQLEMLVNNKVRSFKPLVPLIEMDWKNNLKNWSEK